MRFLSLFSGIEAASAAWEPLGWQCAGVADIDAFACSLLAQRYPGVPNLGDVSRISEAHIAALGHIDLVVFGSPCQDLSKAGKRKGFDGERSSLFFDAIHIMRWARKHCGLRWALWENVVGAFSSNDGADFAAVVGHMAGMPAPAVPPRGWGTEGVAVGEALLEWATLNASGFGVPQHRRRVYAVADLGNWANRPPVLLERAGVQRHPEAQRAQEEAPAAAIGRGVPGRDGARQLVLVTNAEGSLGLPYLTVSNLSKTVNNQTPLLVFANQEPGEYPRDFRIRRFMPLECERLHGFPDNHTCVEIDGKPATDNPRYRALGNTMCVNVMRWIGQSIDFAHHY